MNQWSEHFEWSFPGGVWGLAAVALVSMIWVAFAYRSTLRAMPFRGRCLLIALRMLLIGLVLFCLCRPTWVRREQFIENQKKVAVIFDASGSMKIKGAGGRTRLDRALQYYREMLSTYRDRADFHFFSFAEEIQQSKNPEELANDAGPTRHTALYGNVPKWLETFSREQYSAAICLTDGIDTSGQEQQAALQALERSQVRQAFVAITTPLPSPAYVQLKKVEATSSARVGSKIPVSFVLQASGIAKDRPLQLTVTESNRVVHKTTIANPQSATTKVVLFDVPITRDGLHVFKANIQNGEHTIESAVWSVDGLSKEKLQVLLYQGALDWGTRHLRGVFDRQDQAELDVKMSVGPWDKDAAYAKDQFPKSPEIDRYGVIILLDLNRSQIQPQMVDTLRVHLQKGGSILFLCTNPSAGTQLGNSPLGEFLPVEFEPASESPPAEDDRFAREVQRIRLPSMPAIEVQPLTAFKLTPEGLQNPIFAFAALNGTTSEGLVPKFQDFAMVQAAKPGAIVLAVHPSAQSAKGPRVLLAAQQFSRGRTAVLATDSLWRWRLSLPTESTAFNLFWKNLLNWLGAGHLSRPFWVTPSVVQPSGRPTEIAFQIPSGMEEMFSRLTFSMVSSNETHSLSLIPADHTNRWKTTITCKPGVTHHLIAKLKDEIIAQCYISGSATAADQELQLLSPDLACLNALASANRGVMVDADQRFDWSRWFPKTDPKVIREMRSPLWHRVWIFAAMLGLIVAELCLRRKYGLV